MVVGVGQGAAAGKLIGEGAPAVRGGKRVAGELRWRKAELLGCLGGAE